MTEQQIHTDFQYYIIALLIVQQQMNINCPHCYKALYECIINLSTFLLFFIQYNYLLVICSPVKSDTQSQTSTNQMDSNPGRLYKRRATKLLSGVSFPADAVLLSAMFNAYVNMMTETIIF